MMPQSKDTGKARIVPFRLLTPDNCADVRIWLDGEEVTNRCFRAFVKDAVGIAEGYVELYDLNEAGQIYLDENMRQPVLAWWHGMVRWTRHGE